MSHWKSEEGVRKQKHLTSYDVIGISYSFYYIITRQFISIR